MREIVKQTIAQTQMFPKGARIVVGLSGGMDSVALLHCLRSLRAEGDWQISAVHIHHGLRGADADADAAFAADFAAGLGIPCAVRRVDVRAEAKRRGIGEEEAGRLLRYALLREEAGADGRIAVAHHEQDQAETVLMRLCRGTGLRGLAGMRPVREQICRPLLYCSRADILRYCTENALSWREDATNRTERYTRNKLRLRVLPLLREINPQAVHHMAEAASLLAEEEDFLAEQAAEAFRALRLDAPAEEVRLARTGLLALHPALRRRVIRLAVGVFAEADLRREQVAEAERLLAAVGNKRLSLPHGVRLRTEYDALCVWVGEAPAPLPFSYPLPPEGVLSVPEAGWTVEIWTGEKNEEISEDACTKGFDYDKIDQTIFCRSGQAGDFIRLRGGSKKCKDLFIDEKVPREQRAPYPRFAIGREVLWLPALRVSAAYAADERTKRFLWIRIRRDRNEGKN